MQRQHERSTVVCKFHAIKSRTIIHPTAGHPIVVLISFTIVLKNDYIIRKILHIPTQTLKNHRDWIDILAPRSKDKNSVWKRIVFLFKKCSSILYTTIEEQVINWLSTSYISYYHLLSEFSQNHSFLPLRIF